MKAPINDNTPVIISMAAITEKTQLESIEQSKDAIDLMISAVTNAADKVGITSKLNEIDSIAVCQGMWPYNNPADCIKEAFNATQATTNLTKIGVLQQQLISDACLAIQQGNKNFCIVAGGEAKYRDLIANVNGINLSERPNQKAPDEIIEPAQELWLDAETEAGLGMPVGYYALMDSVYQAENNLTVTDHRQQTADLYSEFSHIAQNNPDAWKRKALSAESIKEPSKENPMLAFPYTKRHNSSWNVNQASAIILCSTAKAAALGISSNDWIFPIAATASNHMLAVSERTYLGRCVGAEVAADKLYSLTEMTPEKLDLIELYSCFPVGVLSFAKALKLTNRKDLTTSGGMPFAGGPLNNYVIQSTVRTLSLMDENNQNALVSNISGMNTKQGLFLYSKTYKPFQYCDLSEEVSQIQKAKPVLTDYSGEAIIIASTILFQKNEKERVVIIAEQGEKRMVAFSQDVNYLDQFESNTFINKSVYIENNQFTLI